MKGNVLIIGASGEIGSAIATKLGKENYQLILHYNKNRGKIDEIRERLAQDLILMEVQADLTEENDVKRFLAELVFPVNHIIFASGNAYYGLLQDMPEKAIEQMISIHVKSPIIITKYLLPTMIKQNYGKILFITSLWGEIGASNEVVYSAVKGAQNSFVKALAKEAGPSGISVNAVSPGFIDTKMNQHLSIAEKEMIFADIPFNRPGKPSEVAELIFFLISNQSSYIQGEVLGVNGGW